MVLMPEHSHSMPPPMPLRPIASPSPSDQPILTKAAPTPPGRRPLATLPKAQLHLHFTGAMRPRTLVELAVEKGVRLPPHLLDMDPLTVPADARGWFRFQRAYDAARVLVRTEDVMRRLVREAAEDDAAEGSVHLECRLIPRRMHRGLAASLPPSKSFWTRRAHPAKQLVWMSASWSLPLVSATP